MATKCLVASHYIFLRGVVRKRSPLLKLMMGTNKKHGSMAVKYPVNGFTLVELMIVVSIIAILTMIAVPSYTNTIKSSRMNGELNAVLGALNMARSEASKRGQNVSVCPNSGTACVANSANWTPGWAVLLTGSAPAQLLVSPGVSHGDTLTSSTTTYPTFTPMGYTFFSGTLSLHDSSNTASLRRCIVFAAGNWSVSLGGVCP